MKVAQVAISDTESEVDLVVTPSFEENADLIYENVIDSDNDYLQTCGLCKRQKIPKEQMFKHLESHNFYGHTANTKTKGVYYNCEDCGRFFNN